MEKGCVQGGEGRRSEFEGRLEGGGVSRRRRREGERRRKWEGNRRNK